MLSSPPQSGHPAGEFWTNARGLLQGNGSLRSYFPQFALHLFTRCSQRCFRLEGTLKAQHVSLFRWEKHVWLFETPWTVAHQASLSFTISWSLLKLTSIKSVMPPAHLILCHPLFLLPSIFSSIRVFSNESALCIRWLKYWSFSINPSNEYSGLISCRIDWFDLLAVQGTLKSFI